MAERHSRVGFQPAYVFRQYFGHRILIGGDQHRLFLPRNADGAKQDRVAGIERRAGIDRQAAGIRHRFRKIGFIEEQRRPVVSLSGR